MFSIELHSLFLFKILFEEYPSVEEFPLLVLRVRLAGDKSPDLRPSFLATSAFSKELPRLRETLASDSSKLS